MAVIIAIDGPVAAGKGAIAGALARRYRLPHLNTGLHYRAVARQVLLNGGSVDDEGDALDGCDFPIELLSEPHLISELVADLASHVAVFPAVRQALFEREWSFAHRRGGAVLEGRDIGTVIAPDADVKFYVTAEPAIRIRHRFEKLMEAEYPIELREVAAELTARDKRDSEREQAPLMAADDAIVLDTSWLMRREAVRIAMDAAEERLA
jgi:cytidylate kinase